MQNIIHIEIELSFGISEAFKYFTVNEQLESWLPEKAEVEPKVGGKYELFWAPENREINSTIGCKVTSIEKDRFVSFEWKGPEQFQNFMNFTDPLTHVIVVFSSSRADESKTTVNLFHTGWRNDPEWKKARDYFEKAWFGALNGLKEKLGNLSE
ncbi:MAG: SRPBCC domain-containing protein [Candidatus Lokiarchaeota archaeon]|nr:SRPBCC domain-containing protein [Candidatus Lokiarchaeota archaeon]